jgi:tetratricopeptide (TPR) repeat protein
MTGWLIGCTTPAGLKTRAERQPISRLPTDQTSGTSDIQNREILPATHMAAGRLHESQSRLARAAEQYRLAVTLKPDYVAALNRLGIVLDRLGRFKEADNAFRSAIAVAADRAYLHNNLAFSYIMQLNWREAEVTLTKALELKPDFARARVNLAMALAQQERFDEALTQFQTVLPAEDAYYNMGLMYQSKRRLVEAARAFKAALELNPEMLAARKRLETLPADVVSEAERLLEAAASPLPAKLAADESSDASERPTTQPAGDVSPESAKAPTPSAPAVPLCLSLSIEAGGDHNAPGPGDDWPVLLNPDSGLWEPANLSY